MQIVRVSPNHYLSALVSCLLLLTTAGTMSAQIREKTLYSFKGNADGAWPNGLVADGVGNLYGTTEEGGDWKLHCQNEFPGCGIIFEIQPGGRERKIYAFKGGNDGAYPATALTIDGAGNLYGTTTQGGKWNAGTIFRFGADGKLATLYSFQGGADGSNPYAPLLMDGSGNLFGTTGNGGIDGSGCGAGCGTVFELKPDGTKVTLYSFQSNSDGAFPAGALVADGDGNLYGTTVEGGSCPRYSFGCGTIFKIAPDGTATQLYSFGGSNGDGAIPQGGLVLDAAGDLYGTTQEGGNPGDGTVFKLAPDGSETVLHDFQGGSDGALPTQGLIMDANGNLIGSTSLGGRGCGGNGGCGTVFEISSSGTETVLYAFGKKRGMAPGAPILGADNKLYGVTGGGGTHNRGAVFELKK